MTLWEQISINFAVLINLLVAFFYPFSDGPGGKKLLEINSVDCQNCFPSLKCFLLCCAPSSRLPSSRARASLISLPIFLVLVPRAHPLSRFPYFLFSSLARIPYLASHISCSRPSRASRISLPIFHVLVPRAHRLSRVPYLLGFSTQALAFAFVEDH